MLAPRMNPVDREKMKLLYACNNSGSSFADQLLNNANMRLDFRRESLDSRITATRASTKTYFDYAGTMRTAAINEFPREYDPSTLVCLGRSFWEARTNLLTYSQEFDNAAWVKADATVTANAVTAPDGTLTADRIVETATTAAHKLTQVATTTNTSPLTLSIFIKAGERTTATLAIQESSPFTRYSYALFDLSAVSVGAVTNNGGAGTSSASIVSVGNGWCRCSLTTTLGGVAASCLSNVFIGAIGGYAGDITKGVYLWGSQLEAGATPTPYIPTTSAAATRAADVVSMTSTNFSSWYNQTEGTFLATAMVPYLDAAGTNRRTFDVTDGTANNRMGSVHANQGGVTRLLCLGVTGGVAQFDLNSGDASGNTTDGTFNSSVFTYKLNDFAASHRGNTVLTDVSGIVPTVNQINIGSLIGSLTFHNGFISRITYWPARLSNTDLQNTSR